ncbi:hypothetical protein ATK36_6260 [Amycolatopsis sulphurea]|uniref:Uncharacterized protein n=2 Tax=Amycolatopsis sulphurea TaxID=76022 RepID=A0A2A9FKN3_9PSEU|nr:hypothetical protein [Amycolatopsis sulphurea]PFG50995.1 hypothetical protein ATK36_6260 [Amycolatopsis sulphurea]
MPAEPDRPPVPPVRPDPELVWQVEGDEPTIGQYRDRTREAAGRTGREEPDHE